MKLQVECTKQEENTYPKRRLYTYRKIVNSAYTRVARANRIETRVVEQLRSITDWLCLNTFSEMFRLIVLSYLLLLCPQIFCLYCTYTKFNPASNNSVKRTINYFRNTFSK